MISNGLKYSGGGICQNRIFILENTTFKVPPGVTQLIVSGCAAGGSGTDYQVPGKAGQFIFKYILSVKPEESIDITVGNGNTIIKDIVLLANTFAGCFENDLLGYKTGINGNPSVSGGTPSRNIGGYGGAFGFGGGAAGYMSIDRAPGNGEAGNNLRSGRVSGTGTSGWGDNGGAGIGVFNALPCIEYDNAGTSGAYNGTYGDYVAGGGGGAGGYGAGGGAPGNYSSSKNKGTGGGGAPGIVIIEW